MFRRFVNLKTFPGLKFLPKDKNILVSCMALQKDNLGLSISYTALNVNIGTLVTRTVMVISENTMTNI